MLNGKSCRTIRLYQRGVRPNPALSPERNSFIVLPRVHRPEVRAAPTDSSRSRNASFRRCWARYGTGEVPPYASWRRNPRMWIKLLISLAGWRLSTSWARSARKEKRTKLNTRAPQPVAVHNSWRPTWGREAASSASTTSSVVGSELLGWIRTQIRLSRVWRVWPNCVEK